MKKGRLFYISTLALVVTLCSVAYFSYAFFIKDYEFNGKLNIVAGEIDFKIESSYLDSNNSMTIPAHTEQLVEIDITNVNPIDSRYLLYYTAPDNENLDIKYSTYKNNIESNININEKKTVILKVTNPTKNAKQITFNVEGGFKDTELTIEDGYEIEELDPITLTINYNDGITPTETRQVLYGEPYNISNITRTGLVFNGWHGKNLLYADVERGGINHYGELEDCNDCLRIVEYIELESGVRYNFSNEAYYPQELYLYNANKGSEGYINVYVDGVYNMVNYSHEINSITKYIRISTISTGVQADINTKFQIEEGDIKTPYEPYYINGNTLVTLSHDHTITAIWTPKTAESTLYTAPTGVNCTNVQCMIEYINNMLTY